MQGDTKRTAALVVVILLAGITIGYSQLQQNGSSSVNTSMVQRYNVSSARQSEAWAGYSGFAGGSVSIDQDAARFATFGTGDVSVLIATTNTSELNESALAALSSAELISLDASLGLSGTESFAEIFADNETLTFGNDFNETAFYKELESGWRTYPIKLIAGTPTSLDQVGFVTEINSGTGWDGGQSDFEVLVATLGSEKIYHFHTV